jgi:hypothetical protein
MEFSIPLNKFEKRELVVKLHKEGKTYSEIAHIAHVSLRDIKPILKKYERKLETKKGENNPLNHKIKKPSISSQAFKLFSDGKNPVQVAIDLNIDFEKVRRYWTEFLRLRNMKKLYNIFIENEFHLDSLFKIDYFLLRNKIPIKDCENVLRVAHDTTKLYQIHSNLKTEIEKLKQIKNNMQYSQYNQLAPLKPLPKPIKWYY